MSVVPFFLEFFTFFLECCSFFLEFCTFFLEWCTFVIEICSPIVKIQFFLGFLNDVQEGITGLVSDGNLGTVVYLNRYKK